MHTDGTLHVKGGTKGHKGNAHRRNINACNRQKRDGHRQKFSFDHRLTHRQSTSASVELRLAAKNIIKRLIKVSYTKTAKSF